jgi:hypothetical protein
MTHPGKSDGAKWAADKHMESALTLVKTLRHVLRASAGSSRKARPFALTEPLESATQLLALLPEGNLEGKMTGPTCYTCHVKKPNHTLKKPYHTLCSSPNRDPGGTFHC